MSIKKTEHKNKSKFRNCNPLPHERSVTLASFLSYRFRLTPSLLLLEFFLISHFTLRKHFFLFSNEYRNFKLVGLKLATWRFFARSRFAFCFYEFSCVFNCEHVTQSSVNYNLCKCVNWGQLCERAGLGARLDVITLFTFYSFNRL